MKKKLLFLCLLLISCFLLPAGESRAHVSAEKTNAELKELEEELFDVEMYQKRVLVDLSAYSHFLLYSSWYLADPNLFVDKDSSLNPDGSVLFICFVVEEQPTGASIKSGENMGVLYNQMLDEIVQNIKTFFTNTGQTKITHDRHIGPFTRDDVKRLANRCPQVLTALHGLDPFEQSDNQLLVFTSFVMTRGSNTNRDGRQMLDMLNILLACLNQMDLEWADDGPEDVRARSLYSGALGDLNTNLWACHWKMRISGITEAGVDLFQDLPVFDEYHGTLEVGDNTVEESYT